MLRTKKQEIGRLVAGIALVVISLMMFAPVYASITFSEVAGITIPPTSFGSTDWGDYDNDGDLDLLITGVTNSDLTSTLITQIWTNNGNGSFARLTGTTMPGVWYSSVEWGDYDNDGDLDFILTGETVMDGQNNNPITQIWTNNGNGTFTQLAGTTMLGVFGSSVDWGDYDNDGDLDFVLTGLYPSSPFALVLTHIWTNNGNGTFTQLAGTTISGMALGESHWGDYDNDGDLDLLLGGAFDSSGYITQIWENKGNSTFTQVPNLTIPGINENGSLEWGDYDKDGDLDVLIGGNTQIWTNNGNNSFSQLQGTSFPDLEIARWGDYDKDGDLDIILTGVYVPSFIPETLIWTNNGNSTFTQFLDLPVGVQEGDIDWVDYDNDSDLDFLFTGFTIRPAQVIQLWRNNLNPNIAPVELLRNRSFEADSDPVDGLADYWGIIGGSSERRLCNLSGTIGRTGPCAFEFRGSATEDSRIQQRIPIASATFNAGDTLTLRGFVRAGGEPNFRLRIIVDYADGTADVGQVRVNTVSTNYVAFPDLALTLTKSNPIQIRVWVWSRSLSGRTYFDDLSLILTKPAPQGLIPMP